MPKTRPSRGSRPAKASEGPPDDWTMSQHCRAGPACRRTTGFSSSPRGNRNQRHILDSDLHSIQTQQRQAFDLTIKGTTSPQDYPLQIMEAYLSVRGATAGTLFLYRPFPRTRREFGTSIAPCRVVRLSLLFNRGECTVISFDDH